jgi:uncharacterized protein
MAKINDEMKKLLNDTNIWVLATSETGGMPNAVPIFYTSVLDDTRLMLVDNFMKKTLSNIQANPKVSVSVWKEKTGYQFKGTASIETSGVNFDAGKKMVQKRDPKGVIIVDIESIYTTTSGPEAGNKVA